MSTPACRLDREGSVLIFTLDRPVALNAIDAEIEQGLDDALSTFESEPDLRVLVLRARGEYFSSGFDVEHRVDDDHDPSGVLLRRRYREIHDLFDRVERVEKPVVLAAQGPCLGGALELAASCDVRLASMTARFALPEIKLGVIPGSGGTSRITRLVGPAWARWLVMLGQPVDAERALAIGLVHAVHPSEHFDHEVDRFVASIAALPHEAMALAKLSIDLCDLLDRSSGRDVERIVNTMLMTSDEHRARIDALKERLSRGDR
jgi:enoyl-CoA hydratase/carnithine racemase